MFFTKTHIFRDIQGVPYFLCTLYIYRRTFGTQEGYFYILIYFLQLVTIQQRKQDPSFSSEYRQDHKCYEIFFCNINGVFQKHKIFYFSWGLDGVTFQKTTC